MDSMKYLKETIIFYNRCKLKCNLRNAKQFTTNWYEISWYNVFPSIVLNIFRYRLSESFVNVKWKYFENILLKNL